MDIFSGFKEDDQSTPEILAEPPEKLLTAAFDPSNPLGFLEEVFEFVAEESDLFKSDSLLSDVNAIVRMVRYNHKVKAEGRKRKEVKSEGHGGKTEKKVKETTPALPPRAEEKAEETVESKVEEGKSCRAPNKGNGLDMEKYSWSQSLQEVNITVPVPSGTKSGLIICEIKKNYIKVGLKRQPPVIEGALFQPVKVEDGVWSLVDQKYIYIFLTKQYQMEWWKYLVKGEPEVDTQKVGPETSKLFDLEPEKRAAVVKMMFDQPQKQMGRPTRDKMRKQDMLKKLMTEHPEVDFSRAEIY